MTAHVVLTADPIDLAALVRVVRRDRHGAVATFLGVTRATSPGDARPVEGLTYEAYPAMALAELRTIVAEAAARWAGSELAIVHRVGYVALGDPSVAVAAAAAHRADAFAACAYAVDELKRRAQIWKREHYAGGGTAWIANTDGRAETAEPAAG